jgi:hypothetical protein
MLRLHSCIWLQNNTSMRLQPCLQLGAGCRTPVVLASGDKLDAMQRLHLRVGGCCDNNVQQLYSCRNITSVRPAVSTVLGQRRMLPAASCMPRMLQQE